MDQEKEIKIMRNQIISMKLEIEKINDYFQNDIIDISIKEIFGNSSLLDLFDSLVYEKKLQFFKEFSIFYNKVITHTKKLYQEN